MAKSKNSTNKNQISKSHRRGIKRLARNVYISNKGCNQKYLRNRRRAFLGDPSIIKSKNTMGKIREKKARNQDKK